MIWTPAHRHVRVLAVGSTAASGAALSTIAKWAADGEEFVTVTLIDQPTDYVVDWEDGDIVAIQGEAHLHVDSDGVVKDVVPDDAVLSLQVTD